MRRINALRFIPQNLQIEATDCQRGKQQYPTRADHLATRPQEAFGFEHVFENLESRGHIRFQVGLSNFFDDVFNDCKTLLPADSGETRRRLDSEDHRKHA